MTDRNLTEAIARTIDEWTKAHRDMTAPDVVCSIDAVRTLLVDYIQEDDGTTRGDNVLQFRKLAKRG